MAEQSFSGFTQRYRLASGCNQALFEDIKANPDQAIRDCARVLKHDRTTTVALIEAGGARWVIKRYNTKNAWHALRRTVRRSRASNCWSMTQAFRQAGIMTPDPIGFVETRFGPLRGKSYFVSAYLDAENLRSYLGGGDRQTEELEAIRGAVVELFRRLRDHGLNHGDMKATNLLVAEGGIVLVDFDASARPQRLEVFERGYAKDRARFLKNWARRPDLLQYFDRELPAAGSGRAQESRNDLSQ